MRDGFGFCALAEEGGFVRKARIGGRLAVSKSSFNRV